MVAAALPSPVAETLLNRSVVPELTVIGEANAVVLDSASVPFENTFETPRMTTTGRGVDGLAGAAGTGAAAGTFVQGGFRGNLAFVGLPIIYSMPDAPLAWGVSLRTAAILACRTAESGSIHSAVLTPIGVPGTAHGRPGGAGR